jgi:hypothetical protein
MPAAGCKIHRGARATFFFRRRRTGPYAVPRRRSRKRPIPMGDIPEASSRKGGIRQVPELCAHGLFIA